MNPSESTEIEPQLPASVLVHLKSVLGERLGSAETTRILHDTGFAVGASEFAQFTQAVGGNPCSLDRTEFWSELDAFLRQRGWGGVEHDRVHSGLGILRARRWTESDPEFAEPHTNCAFGAGLLAHILGCVAPGPVAVLEVSCRSRGDDDCAFLFGSEDAIHAAHEELGRQPDLDRALQSVI